MESLYTNQERLLTGISNSFENFKKNGKDRVTKGHVQAKVKSLENNYKLFQENHQEILDFEDLSKDHAYFSTNLYDNCEDAFYDNLGDYKNHVLTLEAVKSADRLNSTTVNQPQFSGGQITPLSLRESLPRVDLPNFNGEYSSWENFRSMFRALINRK